MDYSKYIVKIKLFNSYFDCNDKIKPTAIFNLFQDVACVNGEQLGVGFEAMLSKNLYWVLSRVKYDIIIAPKVDEEVFVETWPCEKGKIDFSDHIAGGRGSRFVLCISEMESGAADAGKDRFRLFFL